MNCLTVILALLILNQIAAEVKYVHLDGDKYLLNDESEGYVAMGVFNNTMMETGWTFLRVVTNSSYDDDQQAYAAGYVEGYLTRELIFNHYTNFFKGETFTEESYKFINESEQYSASQYNNNKSSPYWYQSHLLFQQINGIITSYIDHATNDTMLTVRDLKTLAYFAELSDLNSTLHGEAPDSDHCSALIKIVEDDILISQNSWFQLNYMTRIYKVYEFPYKLYYGSDETIPSTIISMSSYPVVIFSFDDFYLTNAGLIVQETTIGNNNKNLTKYILPNSTFVSIRTMIANRLSTNGQQWGDYYAFGNNGCYLNQFMVLNTNLYESGQPLQNGTFFVIEQLPGYTFIKDMTETLKNKTYWASYNSGAFNETRTIGNMTAQEVVDDYYTYDQNPRAKIFRRDHVNVKDIPSMRKIMRYNNYKNDPYSLCTNCTPPYTGCFAIAMRGDLNDPNGKYPISSWGFRNNAALDAKISSVKLFKDNMKVNIIAGPTNEDVPTFQWSTYILKNKSHVGLPDKYDFNWLIFNTADYSYEEVGKEDDKKNNVIFLISMITLGAAILILVAYFVYRYIKSKKASLPTTSLSPNNVDTQQPLLVNE